VEFTAVSWNLFHGRDFPPEPALFTWRSRLLGTEERGETYAQVNRDLEAEFTSMLAAAKWDVALLQECPPRFAEPLADACRAESHRVLTSRNSLSSIRTFLARRNPDLIASAEGGSNLTLVRDSFQGALPPYDGAHQERWIVERREVAIHTGRPERRAMALTRTASGLCIANLHATNDAPELATADILRAAEAAVGWAGDSPLLFGGDLNLRPGDDPDAFTALGDRFGLTGPTHSRAIDHLLVRNLNVVEAAAPWPAGRRELPHDGLRLRLSDHAPVEARFETGSR
jgi:endonuclease/exonuclease/phosphatase family metal-dependent hydrolase